MSTISSAGMVRGVHRLADLVDPGARARRGLVVHDAHGLDLVRLVLLEPRLDRVGIGADAPVGRQHLGLQAEPLGHVPPQHGELARLDDEHVVARRQRIDEAGFPRARARRRDR